MVLRDRLSSIEDSRSCCQAARAPRRSSRPGMPGCVPSTAVGRPSAPNACQAQPPAACPRRPLVHASSTVAFASTASPDACGAAIRLVARSRRRLRRLPGAVESSSNCSLVSQARRTRVPATISMLRIGQAPISHPSTRPAFERAALIALTPASRCRDEPWRFAIYTAAQLAGWSGDEAQGATAADARRRIRHRTLFPERRAVFA